MKNILIIKLSAIGDVIHALPTAYAIKKTWPDCHLTWVVSPTAADIVKDSPAIDEVIIFDRKKMNSFSSLVKYIKPFSRELNKQHYDVSIDLQGLFKSALVAFLSHADQKVGYADMREGSSLVSRPIKGKNFNGHIIDRYLDVVQALGCDTDNTAFPIGITEENKKNAQQSTPNCTSENTQKSVQEPAEKNADDSCDGLTAEVIEKTFAGGQLRVVLKTSEGQEIVASRYGIDTNVSVGEKVRCCFLPTDAVLVDREERSEEVLPDQSGPCAGGTHA